MKRLVTHYQKFLMQAALAALLASLLVLPGCFSSNKKDVAAFAKPTVVDTTFENYILQPPDVVEVHCSKVAEINMQQQQIRPDGKISFESIGEVQAAGKTPKELAAILQEKVVLLYALTGQEPIDVRVVVFKSKMFYVMGQVLFPGAKQATGRDTVLTALAQAEPTNLGWVTRIQVVRPSPNKAVKPKVFEVNLTKMIENGDTTNNVLLEEGDIIYVPPTVLASIGLKIGEFIGPFGQALTSVSVAKTAAQ